MLEMGGARDTNEELIHPWKPTKPTYRRQQKNPHKGMGLAPIGAGEEKDCSGHTIVGDAY
jgi:hypothetical protein